MSCGIIRVQKFSAGSVKGIEIHDTRVKGVSHTNQDIDWERSAQNYHLHENHHESYQRAIKVRIDQLELKKAVRKDAKIMCQALVTSDKAFFDGLSKEKREQFFKDSYDFLCERYGKGNILSATVHMDEKTPHMHVNFVPVTADGRLSAKDVVGGRKDLNAFQTAFFENVARGYGLERGTEGSRTKHQTVAQFKTATAKAELATIQEATRKERESYRTTAQEHVELACNASNLQNTASELEARIKSLEEEKRALETLEGVLKTKRGIDRLPVKISRSIFGKEDNVTISKSDYDALVKTALASPRLETAEKLKQAEKIIDEKNTEIQRLKVKNKNFSDENMELQRALERSKSREQSNFQERMENEKWRSRLQNVPPKELERLISEYAPQKNTKYTFRTGDGR